MKTTFYIVINIKTIDGFQSFGRFFIGNNREAAYALFSQLKGNAEFSEQDILHLDLMETRDNLPISINVMSCTLDQLSANCKIITKEVFKLLNLEEAG